jgi:hypothetical protein
MQSTRARAGQCNCFCTGIVRAARISEFKLGHHLAGPGQALFSPRLEPSVLTAACLLSILCAEHSAVITGLRASGSKPAAEGSLITCTVK